MKLGIAGDAFFIFMGIMLIALFTIPLWYPYLARALHKVSTDLEDTDNDPTLLRNQPSSGDPEWDADQVRYDHPLAYPEHEAAKRRHEERMAKREEDDHVTGERLRVPRRRAETPQERYARILKELEEKPTPKRKRR